MNQKAKPTSTYIKQPNSYSTSPRLSRRIPYCHKSTNTIEKYPTPVSSQDQDCQTDPVEEPLQRDYMEALRYINECHDVINQMFQQTKGNPRIPEVPNFIDLYTHINGNRGNLTDIANQDLQQNISQTRCTLIDSPYDGSVNTNNYQECSSPESDYELLAEPLITYTKKEGDIKRAKCRLNGNHVLQDSRLDEMKGHVDDGTSKGLNKNLNILYENNFNWRVSDHGKMCQKQKENFDNDVEDHVRNKPHEMTSMDFENIIEELAQHAQQKYKKGNTVGNMQQPQNIEEISHSDSPIKCKTQRIPSPNGRGEANEDSYYSPNDNSHVHYEARPSRKQHSPNEYQTRHHKSNHVLQSPQQNPQCCNAQTYHDHEVPASKLLQKSRQNKTEQEYHTRQIDNCNITSQVTCQVRELNEKYSNEKIPFNKAQNIIQTPNSFDELLVCKKHSKELVKNQCSDSDIDEEFYNEKHNRHRNKNMQRSCMNTSEEHRAVIRPNRTELISTVKYGRKVVMRTELPPSEHPNFRQQRQSEEQIGAKCGGDSSDISSDPDFSTRS